MRPPSRLRLRRPHLAEQNVHRARTALATAIAHRRSQAAPRARKHRSRKGGTREDMTRHDCAQRNLPAISTRKWCFGLSGLFRLCSHEDRVYESLACRRRNLLGARLGLPDHAHTCCDGPPVWRTSQPRSVLVRRQQVGAANHRSSQARSPNFLSALVTMCALECAFSPLAVLVCNCQENRPALKPATGNSITEDCGPVTS